MPIFLYAELDGANSTLFALGSGDSNGNSSVATLRVPCGRTVQLRVAISFIDQEHAQANLRAQAPAGTSAMSAKASAEALWQSTLDGAVRLIDAADADAHVQRSFLTAAYRTRLAPTIWSEPGRTYLGMDGRVHALSNEREHAYTDMSLWDVHRTQLPWLSLTAPSVHGDVLRSLDAMGNEGGDVPRWPLANAYTNCMVGNHAIVVLAEAVAKKQHLGSLNVSRLYGLLKRHATTERPHASRRNVAEYLMHGYVPVEAYERSASLTLAFAFDDAALATIARHLGAQDDAAVFGNRSANAIRAGWSAERQLMCPRRAPPSGALQCPLAPAIPYPGSPHYIEGDAWQWLWFAPSDPSELVKLFPSAAAFEAKLDTFLNRGEAFKGTTLADPYYCAS